MKTDTLWSLRLGFSGKQSDSITRKGIKGFLKDSFAASFDTKEPAFLSDDPKTLAELKDFRDRIKNADSDESKKMLRDQLQNSLELKTWWLDKMINDTYPLREKMVCFWHNHFVSTSQKVKVNYWIYLHNQLLREQAFGNFKTLTKKVIQTNAMVRYLDNVDNKRGKINENLSRELLELFTLGIGNYTEDDIKNGAKALSGLGLGEKNAQYRPLFEDPDTITYLGKTGKFKADDLVDIIFEQKNSPYRITRKLLKWFIYDNPKEELVQYYGDYLRKQNFEIQPLLIKMFTEEYDKQNAGSKIKNPLEYILPLLDELHISEPNLKAIAVFLRQQQMDLFNQPNVKGWDGGKSWLTSQVYLQRNTVADLLCRGRFVNPNKDNDKSIAVSLKWNPNGTNKTIITELKERLLFQTDSNLQQDFENILKYDFNPKADNADLAVLRLFNAMIKTPEYQLI
ncbi:DUF1800 domain-containing protein [Flavobacterium cerinum]|uniref:DUF1800 domain-containing protein n=1 Tax=Flavobacterium cerinum TaxID=2502784 RepID=A0ABY5IW95_9FLAO|nr:DUF1800 domain-containing protein [Flavobacterium cerinum]UUC47080.1 DUF1800 domain-containing protein [Flavobacterium cerinum]